MCVLVFILTKSETFTVTLENGERESVKFVTKEQEKIQLLLQDHIQLLVQLNKDQYFHVCVGIHSRTFWNTVLQLNTDMSYLVHGWDFILNKSETSTVTLENGENGNSKICDTGAVGHCHLLYRTY